MAGAAHEHRGAVVGMDIVDYAGVRIEGAVQHRNQRVGVVEVVGEMSEGGHRRPGIETAAGGREHEGLDGARTGPQWAAQRRRNDAGVEAGSQRGGGGEHRPTSEPVAVAHSPATGGCRVHHGDGVGGYRERVPVQASGALAVAGARAEVVGHRRITAA